MPIAAIIDGALEAGDEGLTLLGGEPFDQPAATEVLARAARAAGLGVIAFTGYRHGQIRDRGGSALNALSFIDLLVDGPFVETEPELDRSLVGSRNQSFIPLSERYRQFEPSQHPQRLDVRVLPTGEIRIAGFVDTPGADQLADALKSTRAWRSLREAE
jgi:anaerobic ribonucleoside-triphosphate reductase activating protein